LVTDAQCNSEWDALQNPCLLGLTCINNKCQKLSAGNQQGTLGFPSNQNDSFIFYIVFIVLLIPLAIYQHVRRRRRMQLIQNSNLLGPTVVPFQYGAPGMAPPVNPVYGANNPAMYSSAFNPQFQGAQAQPPPYYPPQPNSMVYGMPQPYPQPGNGGMSANWAMPSAPAGGMYNPAQPEQGGMIPYGMAPPPGKQPAPWG
jgi:hypothetical protein